MTTLGCYLTLKVKGEETQTVKGLFKVVRDRLGFSVRVK